MFQRIKQRLQRLLGKLPQPLRNKFVLATGVFAVWMLFFDRNSIWSQYQLQTTLRELKNKKIYYNKEIKQAEKDNEELFTNDRTLEKFAREHYLMKKDNEEIFVFEEKH